MGYPVSPGLYDPANAHDACGVGFVADIRGRRSHQIVLDGDTVLRRMEHRGACGAEGNTGDGAGILTALPHELLRRRAREDLGISLPEAGRFAAGNVFLPRDARERAHCKRTFARLNTVLGPIKATRLPPPDSGRPIERNLGRHQRSAPVGLQL